MTCKVSVRNVDAVLTMNCAKYLIWILSFVGFAENVSHRTIEKKIVQSPDKITLNSQNDHKILAFLKGKKEVSFTAITQQNQLRKIFGSSDSILSELETD